MGKEKDLKLVNIYIKIHKKRVLTMNDLAYLASHNPECFRITRDRLIYKTAEIKAPAASLQETFMPDQKIKYTAKIENSSFEAVADDKLKKERVILHFFENLKKIESSEISSLHNIDASRAMELVGNIFMEYLFPYNELQEYFHENMEKSTTAFNVRV